MKEDMTDAEIAEAIIKFFKGLKWSMLFVLFGAINTGILLYMAYDFIFFDGGFDHHAKGLLLMLITAIAIGIGLALMELES